MEFPAGALLANKSLVFNRQKSCGTPLPPAKLGMPIEERPDQNDKSCEGQNFPHLLSETAPRADVEATERIRKCIGTCDATLRGKQCSSTGAKCADASPYSSCLYSRPIPPRLTALALPYTIRPISMSLSPGKPNQLESATRASASARIRVCTELSLTWSIQPPLPE